MSPQDVIDSYVLAVARQLPANLRNDVAQELRGQLLEELAAGGTRDEQAALALVRRFGRPAEIAARYHAPYTIVDPADTRSFIFAAIAGALLIPPANARLPISIDPKAASLLFLAWIGALVLFFAGKSYALRRWPDRFAWSPSPRGKDVYVGLEWLAVLALVALEILYLAPGPVAAFLSGGRIDAARLVYAESFIQPLRLWGFAILLPLAAAFHLSAALRGRWNRIAHAFAFLLLISAGIQLGWHAAYGQIFADPATDAAGRVVFQLVGGVLVLFGLIEAYRAWSRAPLAEIAAARSV